MKVASQIALALAVGLQPTIAGEIRQEDPLEARVKSVAVELRCPVCQGESIYDSHSMVAAQMKSLIREQIAQGRTDSQIKAFFEERYGKFVLMEPPSEGGGWLIWGFPFAALLGAAAGTAIFFKRRANGPSPAPMTTAASSDELIEQIRRISP